jgi:hypothetical protein
MMKLLNEMYRKKVHKNPPIKIPHLNTHERLPLEKEQFIENFNKVHALTCNIIDE